MVQKVMASGIKYNRAVDACNELDISPATLQSRLNSKTKKWRDWYRIKDKEEEKKAQKKKANISINGLSFDLNTAITELCILKIKEDRILEYKMKRSVFDDRVVEKINAKIIINSTRYIDLSDAIAELCTIRMMLAEE